MKNLKTWKSISATLLAATLVTSTSAQVLANDTEKVDASYETVNLQEALENVKNDNVSSTDLEVISSVVPVGYLANNIFALSMNLEKISNPRAKEALQKNIERAIARWEAKQKAEEVPTTPEEEKEETPTPEDETTPEEEVVTVPEVDETTPETEVEEVEEVVTTSETAVTTPVVVDEEEQEDAEKKALKKAEKEAKKAAKEAKIAAHKAAVKAKAEEKKAAAQAKAEAKKAAGLAKAEAKKAKNENKGKKDKE